jgi:hypothetical protein
MLRRKHAATVEPTASHPNVNPEVSAKLSALIYDTMPFPSVTDMDNENIKRADIPGQKDQLIYDKMAAYSEQFGGALTLHDGAKKTIIAAGADQVLKIYPKGVFDVEKKAYDTLSASGANMQNFVGQHDWDEATHTARADALRSSSPPGDHTAAAREIQTDLASKGLFLNDLKYGDNIGTSSSGRAVVFDVKSLVPFNPKSHVIP